jgi:dCTP deaminase
MKKEFQKENLGALPFQDIHKLVLEKNIVGAVESNIKPASLDLSISDEIYEVDGIFLPKKGESVRKVLSLIKHKKHDIKKALSTNKVYLIKLNEKISLPKNIYAYCNPKSTSGRIDTHVRLIADSVSRYDTLSAGFKGEIWISVVSYSFSILLYKGLCLNQIRFFNQDTRLSDSDLEKTFNKEKLLWYPDGSKPYDYSEIQIRDNDGSVILTLDIDSEVVGFEGISEKSKAVLDLSKIRHYEAKKFFKPVKKTRSKEGYVIRLKKDSFYILSTYEAVRIPPDMACEMYSVDDRCGDFRSHYAGFIDPGWGYGKKGEGKGRPLTLEVRPFEDLIIRHNQPIGKIKFEKMSEVPQQVYDEVSSNYVVQKGPKLAKHFK